MMKAVKVLAAVATVMFVSGTVMAQQQQYPQQYPQQQYPQQQYPQQQYQQQPQYQPSQVHPSTGAQNIPGYQQQQPGKTYVVPRYGVPVQQQSDIEAADGVFGLAKGKAIVVFRNIRSIVFILGGFALVGLAVMAIFGKPNWKWFAMLAVGLFIVAVAGAIVEFLGGQKNDLGNTIQAPVQQQPIIYQQPVQQPQQPVYR